MTNHGRGCADLRRAIAPAMRRIGNGANGRNGEEGRSFMGEETASKLMVLNAQNRGEKITGRFPIGDEQVTCDDVTFPFLFLFIYFC